MRTRTTTLGVLFATTTAIVWGGQFVVGKSALESVNAFPLSTIRYALAAALWLVVLAVVEGPGALRLEGRGWRLFWLGSLGFAGFNLLAYTGLAHARPETASLIVALGPLLTALVLWRRTRLRPARATFVLLGLALLGVALVVSAGHPSSIVHGAVGWGEALVLAGVFSFVLYGLGAAEHPELSPLRYTALTAGARVVDDRRRDRRRDRGGAGGAPVRRAALIGRSADRVSRDPGRLRRRPDLERRDRLDRAAERRPVQQPDPGHDLRDRDRPRLSAQRRRAPRRGVDDRRARREQPARHAGREGVDSTRRVRARPSCPKPRRRGAGRHRRGGAVPPATSAAHRAGGCAVPRTDPTTLPSRPIRRVRPRRSRWWAERSAATTRVPSSAVISPW